MTIRDLSADQIFTDVQKAVASQLGIDTAVVLPGTRLADLDIDSLERMEVVLQLEKHFAISLDSQQVRQCETLGNLADLVQTAISTQTTAQEEK